MRHRVRICIYLIIIIVGLGLIGYLYWDTARHRRTLATDPAQEYWLHVPHRCKDDRDCPAFVFVHGMGGSGRDFIKAWRSHADREGFILICPTFSPGYHLLEGDEDKALIAILQEVEQRYPIAKETFMSGFSGGAQFAYRFAFAHPDRVTAVATHSAGSYDPPPAHTRHIPFLVTVGLNDTSRVEAAHKFARKLRLENYDVTLIPIEKVGHRLSKQAIQETIEFLRRVNKQVTFFPKETICHDAKKLVEVKSQSGPIPRLQAPALARVFR